MSEFNEFDHQGSVPERNVVSIISHAFEMYKGVALYALITMIIYVVGDFIVQSLSGYNAWSTFGNMKDFDGDYSEYLSVNRTGMPLYYSFLGLFWIFLSPLFVGLIYITNKYNTKITVEFSDLFIGYRQNLGNILLYSLITGIVFCLSVAICGFPLFFVYPLFLLGYPVLLFENSSAIEAITKTYTVAKDNYGTFLLTAFLGLLLSACGIILCCIGLLITLPFIMIVMYSAYCAYLGKPTQITYK